MLISLALFALSLSILIYASEKFISSAEKIGYSMGISPFVIGVTIVAFGTSIPELGTSIFAVTGGVSEVVINNVVGSNITNILLVTGVCALAAPSITIEKDIMKEDIPMLAGSAILLLFSCRDGNFSTYDLLIFISGLVIFIFLNARSEVIGIVPEGVKSSWRDFVVLVISAIIIFLSARFTIEYLQELAVSLEVSPGLVSITLLALGTSLPEVVVGIIAVRKAKFDIAIGSIIGSNIFNTLAVMPISALFGVLYIPEDTMGFGIPFLIAVTFLFVIMVIGKSLSRWKGMLLLLFYFYFVVELIQIGVV